MVQDIPLRNSKPIPNKDAQTPSIAPINATSSLPVPRPPYRMTAKSVAMVSLPGHRVPRLRRLSVELGSLCDAVEKMYKGIAGPFSRKK